MTAISLFLPTRDCRDWTQAQQAPGSLGPQDLKTEAVVFDILTPLVSPEVSYLNPPCPPQRKLEPCLLLLFLLFSVGYLKPCSYFLPSGVGFSWQFFLLSNFE